MRLKPRRPCFIYNRKKCTVRRNNLCRICKETVQQYLEECKYIWQNYVPKSGKSYDAKGEEVGIWRYYGEDGNFQEEEDFG